MQNAVYPVIGKQTSLPFYLTGIGISNPEYRVKRETGLISHQFLFTSSGSGVLKVGENSYTQKPRSIFYLSPYVPHEYYPQNDEWITNWFVFRGEYVTAIMTKLGFSQYNTANEISCFEQLTKIFNRIIATTELYDGEERASLLIYEFIMAVKESILFGSGDNSGAGSVIENSIRYIKQNYQMDITLEDLARISDISLQHFCRVFKAKIGMRPMEYIARIRVASAKGLLTNTGMSISEIGRKVGYEDQNYFGIVFRKYEGMSPSEYRKLKGSIII